MRLLFVSKAVVCLIFLVGQGAWADKNPFMVQPFSVPEDVPEIGDRYRSQWSRLSGFELSGLHWNTFVVVYTNLGGATYRKNFFEYIKEYEAMEEDEDYDTVYAAYPVGTVVLKENYLASEGRPGNPFSLTFMIKRAPGFDPEGGDWEYYETTVDGKVIVKGGSQKADVSERCASCHKNIQERDFIFSTFFTETRK